MLSVVFFPQSLTWDIRKDNKTLLKSRYCISTGNQHSQHTQRPQHSSSQQQRSAQRTSSSLSAASTAAVLFAACAKYAFNQSTVSSAFRGGRGTVG